MGLCSSTNNRLRSTAISGEVQQQNPHIVSIHILDDDSLLNIFYLYRPYFLGEDEEGADFFAGGSRSWRQGYWWYRLTHVCRRWRNLMLRSASYLHLSLVCTNGTPVADMLAHSPPLPLTVDYTSMHEITAEDEEGILLALEQRDRLRHIRFVLPARGLQKLITAVDGEFPILEYLIIETMAISRTVLNLPETLQVPHLRHLALVGFVFPIRSQLHPTSASLVVLRLLMDHQFAYFQPNVLLQWVSSMPQLERLDIGFSFPVPNRDVETQLTRTPITTHIILPNLRVFRFQGVSAYLEAVVCQITTPRLETLDIMLFKQLTFSVPRLLQFMNITYNLPFNSVAIKFSSKRARVQTHFHLTDAVAFKLSITVYCWHLDWQVSFAAQILNALSEVFSATEHLILEPDIHGRSSEEHNDVNRMDWRNLLRPFSNVKTLLIEDGLVDELSRCLRLEDGELPLGLLPELQELTYIRYGDADDAFTSFLDARLSAGRPVTVVRRTLGPDLVPVEPPVIVSPNDEAGNDFET